MEPQLFEVVIENDDKTSFQQATETLIHVFGKDKDEAQTLAHTIHKEGMIIVGEYLYEIAETKVAEVQKINELNSMDLQCYIDNDAQASWDMITDEVVEEITQRLKGMGDDALLDAATKLLPPKDSDEDKDPE